MGDIPKLHQLAETHLPISASVLSREKFASSIGLPIGVVVGWCDRGYLPLISIGKYSLINVALFHKQCLEQEFK